MHNITNATYHNANNNSINVDFDGVSMLVPIDSSNRHYVEIKSQIDAGTLTIAAYVAP